LVIQSQLLTAGALSAVLAAGVRGPAVMLKQELMLLQAVCHQREDQEGAAIE